MLQKNGCLSLVFLVDLPRNSIHRKDVPIVCDDLVLLELETCVSADFSEVSFSVTRVTTHWQGILHVFLEPAVLSSIHLCHVHEFVV